jgi:hypothetical protein
MNLAVSLLKAQKTEPESSAIWKTTMLRGCSLSFGYFANLPTLLLFWNFLDDNDSEFIVYGR